MRILGLDEAGRGCVLGPLVVGGFWCEGPQDVLRGLGADDSKALSAKQRQTIAAHLASAGTAVLREVQPSAIDEGNLNALEVDAFLDIIREVRPDHVFLDAPVNPRGIPRLQEELIRRSGVATWTIEPRADATYPVVGAASIFAKLRRDAHIDALGPEVGSGYPSDPLTRAWLKGFITRSEAFPACVRTRWGTLQVLRQGSLF